MSDSDTRLSHTPPSPLQQPSRTTRTSTPEQEVLDIVGVIDRIHLAEERAFLLRPRPIHTVQNRPDDWYDHESSSPILTSDQERDFILNLNRPLRHTRTTTRRQLPSTSSPLTPSTTVVPSQMSQSDNRNFSLRPANISDDQGPCFKHTRNVQVNHELDALKTMYDTLKDNTPGFTADQKYTALIDFISKRAATIRIGSHLGWNKVPESELIQDFSKLGVDAPAAQQAISAGKARSHTTKSRGRGRPQPKRNK